jgi:hypothetical protein
MQDQAETSYVSEENDLLEVDETRLAALHGRNQVRVALFHEREVAKEDACVRELPPPPRV